MAFIIYDESPRHKIISFHIKELKRGLVAVSNGDESCLSNYSMAETRQ